MEKSVLLKAIEDWEESVKWIEYGWDCIEEYTHDLMSREYLDEEVAKAPKNEIKSFTSRIEKADQRFLKATFPNNRCVWSSYIESEYGYSQEKHWYYYRWPNDLRKQVGT
ncbi:hypothetical protein JWG42_16930 [Desulfoprunum benzoelyticum]|uniref:Uncharacterized protein n=1 Tax=Desulfoprunum benzoelyticum TaxID=1506996 RepID=A0A840V234_9BACT|nr:hypothetical protein [Desulfoprunum benzoelyticum]MBB5349734.1 hypothetical protein [Desulfoprunum benzoelyticum]MBM9531846.1 hypothetical protein [Desulfoprunum benzoelyticum]